jgi:outer membrane autotransporter protein
MRISDQQLATGLQAIAPVQANAQKQMSVESAKMGLISGRLLDLRSGARGFTVGSNGLNRSTADSAMRRDVRTARAGATGGGAAADSELAGRLGGFLNVSYSWGNVDQTTEQDPYDYDSYTILAGIDYRVSDALVIGGTINYTDTQSDYDRSLGDVEARTWGFGAYGTWYSGPWYVDAFVGWGSVDYDTRRNINIPSNNPAALPIIGSATASPGGEQFTAAIGVGRNYDYGTWVITPTARLGYIRVKNDSFEESEPQHGLGLRVEERTLESLQSALGARFSTNVSTSYGVFGPYFTASWIHEFENDAPSILSRYVNDPNNVQFFIPTASPTSDYAVLTVGTTATLPNNVSAFVQFGAALGLEDQSNYALIAGVRKQF